MKPIAICKNERIFNHSTQWTNEWIKCCKNNKIPYEIVDGYKYDIVDRLQNYSGLMWHFSNYVISDLLEARNILNLAGNMGLSIFPDYNTSWHFDDKVAEMYALQSVHAPIPNSWVFYDMQSCREWLEKAKYPFVAKLRCGSGANNVKLIKNKKEAEKYMVHMFGKGTNPMPSIFYKAYSKVQSSYDFKTIVRRAKRIPEFLNTRKHAKQMPVEKGYCYFQEYVKNCGFDIKMAVVGDKASYIVRKTRKRDFRASGGGDLVYNRSLVPGQVISSAFEIKDKLGLQCIGFDYVVDLNTKEGKIIEMSYGFDYKAVERAGGFWDRSGNWHKEPLNVPEEIVKHMVMGTGSR